MRTMLCPETTPASSQTPTPPSAVRRYFLPIVVLIILCGVGRSWWATALDGFTFDEAYHIAAGATYLRLHDFRVNPEHPPLVKFVAGLAVPSSVLHLSELPRFDGKEQEREYAETAVYLNSDPRVIQRRVRMALSAFHALLLLILAFLLKRLFNAGIAIVTLGLILLDPTVAAHLPVVMTDLPLALLGAISVALATLVLRDGRRSDAVFLGLAAALTLGTKHSALLVILPVLLGCPLYVVFLMIKRRPWTRTVAQLVAAMIVGSFTLWGLYGFRYAESHTAEQQFNRPLELKISDLQSLHSRAALTFLSRYHLAPRAYIWGLADTMRAGIEGRDFDLHVFGRVYETRPPGWVPLAYLLIKIPIGIAALALAGFVMLFKGELPLHIRWPLLAFLAVGFFFLGFVCLKGFPYAGVRHLLFLVPIVALLATISLEQIFNRRSQLGRIFAGIAIVSACWSVLLLRRPWEYHNVIAGGTANAWKQFNNESVDLSQRSNELFAFYKEHANGEPCHVEYWITPIVGRFAGIPETSFDFDKPISPEVSGWFYMRSADLSQQRTFDLAGLREAEPTARFGNLMIYHGTYHLPGLVASAYYWRAKHLMYTDPPDLVKAEAFVRRVLELEPTEYTSAIDMGNFALKRKQIPEALSWYRNALSNSPPQFKASISEQITRLSSGSSAEITPLHNPSQE
jgi:hypothetical protein